MKFNDGSTIEHEDKEIIIADFAASDMKVKDLCEKYNISRSTFKNMRIKLAPDLFKYKRKIRTKAEKLKIVKDYKKGITIVELEKKYDIQGTQIRKITAEYKIPRRPMGDRHHQVNHNFLDNIDSEEKAYFLGLFCADGYHFPKQNKIDITLHCDDVEILNKIKEAFDSTYPIYEIEKTIATSKTQGFYRRFLIHSKQVSKKLLEYNIPQAKSLILEWPICIPSNLESHFIRGYLDGDGSISQDHVSFIGSRPFINKLKEKLNIQGIICNTYEHKLAPKVLQLSVDKTIEVFKVIELLYKDATIYMDRKYKRACQFIQKRREPGNGKKINCDKEIQDIQEKVRIFAHV